MFEKILATNLINFIIMVWLLSIVFKKAKLGDMLQRLADDVRKKIEQSKENAQRALDDYENTKAGVGEVVKKQENILQNAKETASAIEKNIKRDTQVCIAEFEESFKALVDNCAAKTKKQTLEQVYVACIELAHQEVEKNLDENTHKHLVEQGIEQISKMDGICL